MSKDEIINYVMNTPGNTNAEVLKGMLNQLDNGGGASSAKLDEIIENKGVGVIVEKENELIWNYTIKAEEWTVHDSKLLFQSADLPFTIEKNENYILAVDGQSYDVNSGSLGAGIEVYGIASINAYESLEVLYLANDIPADHTFTILKNYSADVHFETPDISEWHTDDDKDSMRFCFTPYIPIYPLQEYTITIDGVEYKNILNTYPTCNYTTLGNKHFFNDTEEDTGEPFYIYIEPSANGVFYMQVEDVGVHSVSIVKEPIEYQKISKEYIPASIFFVNEIYDADENINLLDKTAGEIVDAYENGQCIFIRSKAEIDSIKYYSQLNVSSITVSTDITIVAQSSNNSTTVYYAFLLDDYPVLRNES